MSLSREDFRDGRVQHSWSRIYVRGRVIEVSTDALTVSGVRVSGTVRDAQFAADMLGPNVYLPTAEVLDARWEQAGLQLEPKPGDINERTAGEHHADIQGDILSFAKPDGTLVADVGKHWVTEPTLTNKQAPLYGWHVPRSAGKSAWKSIKLHPPASGETKDGVIQPLPVSNFHNHQHKDYSMTIVLMRVQPEDLDAILPKGYPRRVPGTRAPAGAPVKAPWTDTSMPYIKRVLEFSLAEVALGNLEVLGVNSGPRIAEYFAPATRLVGDKEVMLGLKSGNWCAASACYAMQAALLDGEQPIHPYRVSGIELERDAKSMGIWGARGEYHPKPGDLRIMTRGTTGWERHVCRELSVNGSTSLTVGGNEGDRWRITSRVLDDGRTLGWVVYPKEEELISGTFAWKNYLDMLKRGQLDPMDEVQNLINQLGTELTG